MSKHSRKKHRKARQKPAKVHFQKTGKNMTSKAGLIPVIKFLDKLGFNSLFRKSVNHERKENAIYRLEDGVFLILTGLIGGAFNIRKCTLLWSGCRVLQKTAGWLRIPDETTLGRLFKEVSARHISEMETFVHTLRKTVWQKALREGTSKVASLSTLWIDVDSSVKTVYGKQEGVAKGYNSHKKGALFVSPPVSFLHSHKRDTSGLASYR